MSGLTVERTANGHVKVFDSASKRSTVYSVDADGIILCIDGFDHSKYRYAVRLLNSPDTRLKARAA